MLENYNSSVKERLIRYAKIDTQSDMHSKSYPSTEKQKDLGRIMVKELIDIGLVDAEMDEHGLVYATLPANIDKEIPVLCFCSHMDTSQDSSGTNVKPIVHENYQGQVITLPDDPSQKIDPAHHPELGHKIGHDVITASGTTLLGADNKAGLAAIMDAMEYLVKNPSIEHGKIRILFTCDEEVGRGTEKVDLEKLGADYGYTIDGEMAGSMENETFSADMATVIFSGVSAHPGYAKGHMVNAVKVAAEFIDFLPKTELAPEVTEKKEPFIHPVQVHGNAEESKVIFILRSFQTSNLDEQADLLERLAKRACEQWPGSSYKIERVEQYRNMKDILDQHPEVVQHAFEAIRRAGYEKPVLRSIRGGTDGSKLSAMGLPCPNIFAGEHAFHSKQEWCTVQDMEKSAETIVHICRIFAEDKR
jgi:tripeptide aminopeptidase